MNASVLNKTLAAHAQDVFAGPAWHGSALWPTLKALGYEAALKPSPFEGYTPWGVALHTAYWKHRGGLLLAKHSDGAVEWSARFFRSPANWPALPENAAAPQWKDDLARIHETHERWMAALLAFPADRWDLTVREGLTVAGLAQGVAAHDVYHTAQIRNMG